ncbi:MAG: polysaccharide biosynthesis tyrosine autokinase [bacterium]
MDETKDRGGAVVTAWLFILWKHKWLVMTFAGLIIASTFVFTRRQTVIYEASTQIVIDLAAPRYLPQGGSEVVSLGLGNTWNTKEFYETQYRIIRSRMVAEKVVEKLGLDRDLAFLGIADIEDPQERAHALEKADAPTLLAGRVKVEPVAESQVVFIKVRDQDPARARLLADEVAEAYKQQNVDRKVSAASEAVEWLKKQAQQLRADALAANEALLAYKQEADILGASLADSQNLLGQELQDARKRLREARQATAALREQMQLVKRLSAAEAQSSVDAVLDNGLIQQLKAQLVGLENERDELLKKYLDKHPDVLTANRKIKRVQEALTVEVAGIKQSLQRKLDVAARAEQRLASEVESLEQDARAMHTKERRYQELSTAVDSKKELLAQVELRLKEAELQADSRANNVRIIDKALTPSVPVSPRLMLNLAVALLISLVGGFGLAFLVEQLDSTVKSQEQLERDFGLTFLGVIPRAAASIKNTDRYILENPTSTAAECVRTVRTNLLFMAPERELRTMLVTSAGPREGKTSTCVNIGATMAYAGSRVLLVDSDLRRPRLHRIFDMTNDRGLTNLILDASVNVADMVQPSGVEGMDVMCSGPLPPNPAELLQTKGFRRTLERLKDSYDRVIFDSPPVVAVTDAQVLGMQLDGALLVVRAGQTTREMLRKARRLLSDVNVHILGALLNSIDVTRRGYGQYYYRYYRQNAAYAEDQPSEVS